MGTLFPLDKDDPVLEENMCKAFTAYQHLTEKCKNAGASKTGGDCVLDKNLNVILDKDVRTTDSKMFCSTVRYVRMQGGK